jgi:hypothetical protein
LVSRSHPRRCLTHPLVSGKPVEETSLHDDTGRIGRVDELVTIVVDAVVANLLDALVYDAVAVVVDTIVADLDGAAVAATGLVSWAIAIVVDAVAADVDA